MKFLFTYSIQRNEEHAQKCIRVVNASVRMKSRDNVINDY